MNNQGYLFGNTFGNNNTSDVYQRLADMRNTPYPSYRTVFNDITDE